jgi:hypothetical protein
MHTSPGKGDQQQNKEIPVIVPEAGDDYLQQKDSSQESDITEIVQVVKNEKETSAQAQHDSDPL